MPPAATPADGGSTALGKTVSELQDGITILENAISGTLLHVTDFTNFSGDPTEQEGHYLVLNVSGEEGATLYHELVGAVKTPGRHQFEDDDRQLIVRVSDEKTQKIKLYAEKKGCIPSVTTYDLSGLTLSP